MILHDLICTVCERVEVDVQVSGGDYGHCDTCGGERTWRPAGFHTDVYGSPQYSDASGQYHSSTREKAAHLADPRNNEYGVSFQEAGDKVGGARKDHTLKRTGFSYPSQGGRTSTGERAPVQK